MNNVAVERAVEVYTDNAEMSVANPLNKRAGTAVEVYTDGAEVSVISSLDRRFVVLVLTSNHNTNNTKEM